MVDLVTLMTCQESPKLLCTPGDFMWRVLPGGAVITSWGFAARLVLFQLKRKVIFAFSKA
jgi:hypothetical protein